MRRTLLLLPLVLAVSTAGCAERLPGGSSSHRAVVSSAPGAAAAPSAVRTGTGAGGSAEGPSSAAPSSRPPRLPECRGEDLRFEQRAAVTGTDVEVTIVVRHVGGGPCRIRDDVGLAALDAEKVVLAVETRRTAEQERVVLEPPPGAAEAAMTVTWSATPVCNTPVKVGAWRLTTPDGEAQVIDAPVTPEQWPCADVAEQARIRYSPLR